MDHQKIIHANVMCILGKGVVLLGPSGAGKSDLSLRLVHFASPLLDAPCTLISDDQTVLSLNGDKLTASSPHQLAGRMEVRGVGILQFDHVGSCEISLALDLSKDTPPERTPDLNARHIELLGVKLPIIALNPFDVSAPEKVISIVQALKGELLDNEI